MPIGSSSTLKPKETLLEDLTWEAIEGEGTLVEGLLLPQPFSPILVFT